MGNSGMGLVILELKESVIVSLGYSDCRSRRIIRRILCDMSRRFAELASTVIISMICLATVITFARLTSSR